MPRWSIPLLVALILAACGLGRSAASVDERPVRIVADLPPLLTPAWSGDRLPGIPERLDETDLPPAFTTPPVAPPEGVAAPADETAAPSAAPVEGEDPAMAMVDEADAAAPEQPAAAADPVFDARAARRELTSAAARWIRRFEGRRSRAYTDVHGNRTVGVGANLDAGDGPERLAAVGVDYDAVREGDDQLDERQIDRLFARDLATAVAAAERLVPDLHQHPMPVRLLAVDLIYTSGATGFTRFRAARAALAEHDYAALADGLTRTRWYRQTNGRAKAHIAELRALIEPQL